IASCGSSSPSTTKSASSGSANTTVGTQIGSSSTAAGTTTVGTPTSAAASSTPAVPTGTPIKIGLIEPVGTTLLNFDYGVAAPQGAAIGINGKGGINGHPVQIDFCNEKNDPNEAARCAQQMVSDKVMATAATLSLSGGSAI